jgi:hypothetical protein
VRRGEAQMVGWWGKKYWKKNYKRDGTYQALGMEG